MESTSIFNWVSCVQDKASKSAPIIFEAISACFIRSEHAGSVKFHNGWRGKHGSSAGRVHFIRRCALLGQMGWSKLRCR